MIMRTNTLLEATESLVEAVEAIDLAIDTCDTLTGTEKAEMRLGLTRHIAAVKDQIKDIHNRIEVINSVRHQIRGE